MMGLQQVYYTSCRIGLRGGAGFQINAASKALDQGVLQLIERNSLYQPPMRLAYARDVPTETFPRTLSFYPIDGSGTVLAWSIYLGVTEADARGGNFFTHSLVAPPDVPSFGALAPIQLWEAPHWRSKAVEQTELPELALPLAPGPLNLVSVGNFLAAQPGRYALVRPLVAAALDCLRHGRRMVLAAEAATCAAWIGVITLALPTTLAWRCAFTTYVREPGALPCHLVGLDPESFASSGRAGLQADWYCFEPAVGSLQPTPPPSSFAAFVAAAFEHNDLSAVIDFRKFCDSLHRPPDFDQLEHLVMLQNARSDANLELAQLPPLAAIVANMLDEANPPITMILDTIDRAAPNDQHVATAAWQLFRSARDATSPLAAQVREWFGAWLNHRAVPTADTADLRAIAANLRTTPLTNTLRHKLADALALRLNRSVALLSGQPIASSGDRYLADLLEQPPHRSLPVTAHLLIALIECIEVGGAAPLLRQEIETASALLVGFVPDNPEVANFIRRRILGGDGLTLTLLVAQLQVSTARPAQLERWNNILAVPEVRTKVQEVAQQQRSQDLLIYLQAFELDPGSNRGVQIEHLIKALEQALPEQPVNLHLVAQWWIPWLFPGQGLIDRPSAIQLLSIKDGALAMQAELLPRVVEGILGQPELDRPAYRVALARLGRLLEGEKSRAFPFVDNLAEVAAWLDRPQASSLYDARRLAWGVRNLLEHLPAKYPVLREQLLTLTLRHLFAYEPAALEVLLKPTASAEVWLTLEQCLKEPRPHITVEQFVRLFAVLATLKHPSGRPSISMLEKPLAARWKQLSRSEQQRVEQILLHTDNDIRTAWERWPGRKQRGGWFR